MAQILQFVKKFNNKTEYGETKTGFVIFSPRIAKESVIIDELHIIEFVKESNRIK